MTPEQRDRASKKIAHFLRKREMPKKQAVAAALDMARRDKLGPEGGYRKS